MGTEYPVAPKYIVHPLDYYVKWVYNEGVEKVGPRGAGNTRGPGNPCTGGVAMSTSSRNHAPTSTPAIAGTVRPTRGFSLRCPLCGADATQALDLDDLETLHCAECEDTYSLADVCAIMAAWQQLIVWVEAAPLAAE